MWTMVQLSILKVVPVEIIHTFSNNIIGDKPTDQTKESCTMLPWHPVHDSDHSCVRHEVCIGHMCVYRAQKGMCVF